MELRAARYLRLLHDIIERKQEKEQSIDTLLLSSLSAASIVRSELFLVWSIAPDRTIKNMDSTIKTRERTGVIILKMALRFAFLVVNERHEWYYWWIVSKLTAVVLIPKFIFFVNSFL